MLVTGLDLSLTGSGVVTIRRTTEGWRFAKHLVESKSLPKGASLEQWAARQVSIADQVIAATPPGLIVIEAPSHGSKFGNPHERAGVWWRVVHALVARGDRIASVSPATRAKYATGSGTAKKPAVVAALRESIPAAAITDHNLADALALAALGWRHLGVPVEASIGAKQLEACRAVRWPHNGGEKSW
ncbi:hypothetical protein [Pseudoclavibacter helvolus]|uniref:Holliday junction resolvasome RuvABC endonuclease subunit n=1 Tax=Pseudoclavibacter helvolus TaxID=255205 RepID=A0A7W4YEK0_9MICO|nr:hypothetical protein [Pseudoclavibacter helvolus]MBB2957302.1 Holliday junction resolvasome RuvABC endonuclease subunit [Pseudoclavibacter helvolus]